MTLGLGVRDVTTLTMYLCDLVPEHRFERGNGALLVISLSRLLSMFHQAQDPRFKIQHPGILEDGTRRQVRKGCGPEGPYIFGYHKALIVEFTPRVSAGLCPASLVSTCNSRQTRNKHNDKIGDAAFVCWHSLIELQ